MSYKPLTDGKVDEEEWFWVDGLNFVQKIEDNALSMLSPQGFEPSYPTQH